MKLQIVCVGNRKESEGYPIISDLALSSATCSSGFPETCPDEDIVFLPYSSGTSGPRKGVAISHYALNAMLKIFNKSVFLFLIGNLCRFQQLK